MIVWSNPQRRTCVRAAGIEPTDCYRWPHGTTHRNGIKTGRLHQHVALQPHRMTPARSIKRLTKASSRYKPAMAPNTR